MFEEFQQDLKDIHKTSLDLINEYKKDLEKCSLLLKESIDIIHTLEKENLELREMLRKCIK